MTFSPRWLFVGTLLLAFLIRIYQLGSQSLWYDEGFSVFVANQPVADLIAHTARDIHPPVYYLLLHFWLTLTGTTDFALAFFSLFFGVATVALVGGLARRLFGDPVGLVAALLAALSPYQVWYSQEVRMYTLAGFLCLLCVAAVVEGLRGRGWFAVYVLAAAAGSLTLYYVEFLLLVLNVIVFGSILVKRPLVPVVRWIVAQVAVLALIAVWLPTQLRQVLNPAVPPWREFTPLVEVLGTTWSTLVLGHAVDPLAVFPLLIVAGLLVVVGIRGMSGWVLAMAVIGPVFVIFLISLITPLFHPRYLFPYSAPLLILLAVGLVRVGERARFAALVAGIALIGGFAGTIQASYTDNRFAPDDFRSASTFLTTRWQPGDVILVNGGYIYAPVMHYWDRDVAHRGRLTDPLPAGKGPRFLQTGTIAGSPSLGGGDPLADFYPTTWQETEAALDALKGATGRLWVIRCYDTVTDPQGQIRSWLDTNGRQFEDTVFSGESGLRVQGYLIGDAAPPGSPVPTNGPLSVSARIEAQTVPDGGSLPIDIEWLPNAPIDRPFRVIVALADAGGRVWAQQDLPGIGTRWTPAKWSNGRWTADPRTLDIPAGTPPGRYTVQVGGYFEGGTPLEFRPGGSRLPVGEVTVEPRTGLADPKVDIPVNRDAGDWHIVGARFAQFEASAGDRLGVEVVYRALRGGNGPTATVRLVGANGENLGEAKGASIAVSAGQLVRDPVDLVVSPRANGPAILEVEVAGIRQRLATVLVSSRDRVFDVPAVGRPIGAKLGNVAELVAVDLGAPTPDAVPVTFVWRSQAETSTNYTVFLQLLNDAGQLVAQADSPPRGGAAPTTGWVQGEVIVDTVRLGIRPGTPPGSYRLIAGMYDSMGARLATGSGDFVELGTVTLP